MCRFNLGCLAQQQQLVTLPRACVEVRRGCVQANMQNMLLLLLLLLYLACCSADALHLCLSSLKTEKAGVKQQVTLVLLLLG